ncbi:class I SAM-dependent methyltransferase [Acidiphilium cryptum]|uniref:Methyltransferase type 11 n=1 Tax=Acidiphilium cryptum (strain JF-5) TaxID=349163 RepID=A5FTA5_ACICJ|nr:methyltransferase domain-containing protein [Acidiphilium cryptum]ABQ28837.1 Methyltransferase type 11 [Acidiphilium cryptum JF-5]
MATAADTAIQPHNLRAAAIWNVAGDAYDEISRGIADSIDHAVRRLAPGPGERVLDVATGTGWTARSIARSGAIVSGVDLGVDLVTAAQNRARAEGLNIDYRVGDAEALAYDDATFDAAISTYGVMFASHPEAAAAELARVTRPGGRLVLTTWRPDSSVFGMFRVLREFMPPPPDPAPPSPFEWGREDRVTALLGEAFDLEFEPGISVYRVADGETAWSTFVLGYGPARTLAASLDERRRADLQRAFVQFHENFRDGDEILVPREYLLSYGTRRGD